MWPFFVYGTLLPRQPNHYLWGGAVRRVQPAVFHSGRLYDMGSYPMLIEGEGEPIRGAVVEVAAEQYPRLLAVLDELEEYYPSRPAASVYRRVRRPVQLAHGAVLEAWLYVGQPHLVHGRSVCGADWVAYAASRSAQISRWWQAYTGRLTGAWPDSDRPSG